MDIFLMILGYVTCGFFCCGSVGSHRGQNSENGWVKIPYEAGHAAIMIIFWPMFGAFYLAYAICRLSVEIGQKGVSGKKEAGK